MMYHRSTDVTWELADDRAVILDAGGSTLTTLNPVGTLIWRGLDEPRASAAVVDQLADGFPGVDRDQLLADVQEFLDQLVDGGLVIIASDRD